LRRRGLARPAPLVVAESWLSDAQVMAHVAGMSQGTFLVQGQHASTLYRADGHKVKGADVVHDATAWPWCPSRPAPDWRYARLRATSPTSGQGTLLLVDKPRAARFSLFCLASDVPATRWRRVWARRHLLEPVCRTLKSLLATDACQVHSEEAS
jgi:hypothetical protein